MRNGARATGLVLGVLADRVFGDPRRGHPVAAFGSVAAAAERRLYRDEVAAGAIHTAALVAATVTLGALTERAVRPARAPRPPRAPRPGRRGRRDAPVSREGNPRAGCERPEGVRLPVGLCRRGQATRCRGRRGAPPPREGNPRAGCERPEGVRPPVGLGSARLGVGSGPGGAGGWPAVAEVAVVAVATWVVLGGTSLVREGLALGRALDAGDLSAARARIPHLCARDPELLDGAGMARAGVESLAENTSDAVVAPLFWGAVAGVPGLLGYRAVNTLDAMVGYRSARYERFGRVAARLDDLVNLVPARLTAVLTVLLAPAVGGSPSDALRAWRRDASGHPSPNAGPVEATAAGALGLRLGGRTEYAHGAEDRPTLGDGRIPVPADLARVARLTRLLTGAATVVAVALALRP